MKTRSGFVSNSSSTSFLVIKDNSLKFEDNPEVLQKLGCMQNDYDYDVLDVEILKYLLSAVEESRVTTVKSLVDELSYDFSNVVRKLAYSIRNRSNNTFLTKFVDRVGKLAEEKMFFLTIDVFKGGKIDWPVKENLKDVVLGTMIAKMISDFEAEYDVEVLIMSFASDNGSSEESLLKYNGLPDIDGCEWVTLSEG